MGWLIGGVAAVAATAALLGGVWSAEAGERRSAGRGRHWFTLRGYPLVIVVMVLGVLFVVPATSGGNGDSGGIAWVPAIVLAVALVLVCGALYTLGRNLAGYDPDAARIAERLSGDEASRRLLTRWLQRARWRRWLGGFLGVVVGVLLSDNEGLGPVVLMGFVGIMAGSLSAELHHWRRAAGPGARAADLTRRHLGDYTVAGEQWLVGLLAAVALGVLAIEALGADVSGVGVPGVKLSSDSAGTVAGTAWPWASAALGVAAVVLVMQWRIVTRRRPALPAELRRADDLARRLAVSRGVAQPGMTLLLTLVGEALSQIGLRAIGGTCQLLAVGLWIGTRRLGLDKLLRAPAAVPAPEPAAPGPAPA